MNLREVKKHVGTLSTRQLINLDAWIHGLLQGADIADDGRADMGERQRNHISYRRETVRCGKKGCKCADGHLHGPYWYAYWTENGKTKSQYIGKRLPKGVKAARVTSSRSVR